MTNMDEEKAAAQVDVFHSTDEQPADDSSDILPEDPSAKVSEVSEKEMPTVDEKKLDEEGEVSEKETPIVGEEKASAEEGEVLEKEVSTVDEEKVSTEESNISSKVGTITEEEKVSGEEVKVSEVLSKDQEKDLFADGESPEKKDEISNIKDKSEEPVMDKSVNSSDIDPVQSSYVQPKNTNVVDETPSKARNDDDIEMIVQEKASGCGCIIC